MRSSPPGYDVQARGPAMKRILYLLAMSAAIAFGDCAALRGRSRVCRRRTIRRRPRRLDPVDRLLHRRVTAASAAINSSIPSPSERSRRWASARRPGRRRSIRAVSSAAARSATIGNSRRPGLPASKRTSTAPISKARRRRRRTRFTGNVGSTLDWFGTVRARVGYLVTPTALLYATGGWAYGHTTALGQCRGARTVGARFDRRHAERLDRRRRH